MPHVVTERCIRCRYTDCVQVCPVDCFHAGPNMLVIDDTCIDCGLCVPECPVNAIYAEDDLPQNQTFFLEFNLKQSLKWPGIYEKQAPLPDAAVWKDCANKLDHIQTKLNEQ